MVGGGGGAGKGEEAGPGRGITKGHFWKPDLPAKVPAPLMTHSKPRASKPNPRTQGPPGSGLNPVDGAREPVSLAGRALHNSEPVESTRSCLARPSHVGSGTSWPNLLNSVSAGVGPCRELQRATRGSDTRNWGSLHRVKGRRGALGGLGPLRGPRRDGVALQ